MTKFKIGDKVRVISTGAGWGIPNQVVTKQLGMKDSNKNLTPNLLAKVVVLGSTITYDEVYGIEDSEGNTYPICPDGLELVESANTYNITLTEDEARTLLVITGNVLGSEEHSPRKHTRSVYEKLNDMLMDCAWETPEYRLFKVMIDDEHYIVFDDYPKPVKTPQEIKIEELEQSIANAQKQLEELKGLK